MAKARSIALAIEKLDARLPRTHAVATQFMLMLSHGEDSAEDPSMVFRSNMHRL